MNGSYARRDYRDGEIIFSEGDRAGEAYLVMSGNVRLEKNEGSKIREIDTIGEGKIFGEMGVISDMNRMATAVAVGPTVVTACQRKELHRRLEDLDAERRDAMRFLIAYCQDFLPFEMMKTRPADSETASRDKVAYHLVHASEKLGFLKGLEPFLTGLYGVLISYAERRLPPDMKP